MSAAGLPRISIVTPSFNQGRFLGQTIRSVLDQDYPNLEYIIIDGGSTDNSPEIIEKYAHRLTYWCSEPDQGHYFAVNKGFERATGEIFAWLNSDDMYVPGALYAVAGIFQAFPKIQWLTTTRQLLFNQRGDCTRKVNIPGYSKDAFLDGRYILGRGFWLGFIQQESTFWSRALWERVGGIDTGLDLAADFDLWCRFYRHAELYGVRAALAGFRQHDCNRSSDLGRYLDEATQSLEALRQASDWGGRGRGWSYLDSLCRIPKMRGVLRTIRRWPGVGGRYRAFNVKKGRDGRWTQTVTRF